MQAARACICAAGGAAGERPHCLRTAPSVSTMFAWGRVKYEGTTAADSRTARPCQAAKVQPDAACSLLPVLHWHATVACQCSVPTACVKCTWSLQTHAPAAAGGVGASAGSSDHRRGLQQLSESRRLCAGQTLGGSTRPCWAARGASSARCTGWVLLCRGVL